MKPDKPEKAPLPPILAGSGHHSSDGRNVVPAGRGHAGHDIFYAAVQMTRMPMILTDPNQADNPIIFCNQAFETLTGYDHAEIIGPNRRHLQGKETDRDVVSRIRDRIAQRQDGYEELFNYRKDGSGFWNALYVSPVFDPGGNLLYFFASQLDVTRRREAEAVLQQSQRLESLGAMAAGVAHEFNNLMTVVLGNIAVVQKRMDQTAPEWRRLDQARRAIGMADRLTQQMLSFARRQFHDTTRLDLNETVGNFDSILQQMAGTEVKLTVELAVEPLWVELDANQLEMALLNLVRNAADAMPQGGPLRIQTLSRQAPCGSLSMTECAEVSIEDQGSGMPDDVLQRATDPFFTTKAKGKGTGLGLSMVNGFVVQSGGTMEIHSQQGVGTKITLRFPRMPSDGEETGTSAIPDKI